MATENSEKEILSVTKKEDSWEDLGEEPANTVAHTGDTIVIKMDVKACGDSDEVKNENQEDQESESASEFFSESTPTPEEDSSHLAENINEPQKSTRTPEEDDSHLAENINEPQKSIRTPEEDDSHLAENINEPQKSTPTPEEDSSHLAENINEPQNENVLSEVSVMTDFKRKKLGKQQPSVTIKVNRCKVVVYKAGYRGKKEFQIKIISKDKAVTSPKKKNKSVFRIPISNFRMVAASIFTFIVGFSVGCMNVMSDGNSNQLVSDYHFDYPYPF